MEWIFGVKIEFVSIWSLRFIKFSNTLVLPGAEPPMIPMIKVLKDGREYKTNFGGDLFRLIYHSLQSSFKFFHCNFSLINIAFKFLSDSIGRSVSN